MFDFITGKKETSEEQSSIQNLDKLLFDILIENKNKKREKSESEKKEDNKKIKKVIKELNMFMIDHN